MTKKEASTQHGCTFLLENDYLNEFQFSYSLFNPNYDLIAIAREYPPLTFLERYGIEITSKASGSEQELIRRLDELVYQTRNLLSEELMNKQALLEVLKEVAQICNNHNWAAKLKSITTE